MRDFNILVDLQYNITVEAETYEEAKQTIKDLFLQEHNIEVSDNDIDKDMRED